MRIDLLKTTPDRAGRYFVKFSDESSMRLYRQTVEDFGLYTGKELSDDEMTELRKAAGQMSAKMRAVRIVSASSVSKKDLQQRLVRKGEDPDQAKQALYEKKVPKAYWDDALEHYPDQTDKIEDFLRSRLDADSNDKEIKKAIDALLRRGHSYGTIRRALNELSFEAEEFPEEY